MKSKSILEQEANKILADYGLYEILEKYGKTNVVGSYRMGLIAWRDLDLHVENTNVSRTSLYEMTDEIFRVFRPTWFEGKETFEFGQRDYFLGFETSILGMPWNVDIWFFRKSIINKAVKYCDNIAKLAAEDKSIYNTIVRIKKELLETGQYGTRFKSIDVYEAVLRHSVRSINDFYELYRQ